MRRSAAWPHEALPRDLTIVFGWLALLFLASIGQAAFASPADGRKPVWIDTDAACGQAETADVDDCWALFLALGSPELAIHGISTVFGNVDEATAFAVTRSILDRWAESGGGNLPPVYRGAQDPSGEIRSPAIAALAAALERDRLTILALGPLTNVAALMALHPQLIHNIHRIIAVAGTRPTQRRLFPGTSELLHFHDLNFIEDPAAFETILKSGVSLSLLPFEAAQKVTITPDNLLDLSLGDGVAPWLATVSQDWMRFWQDRLGIDGFHPFDTLAVGYLIDPRDFDCAPIPARVKRTRSLFFPRDTLEISLDLEPSTVVTFCSGVDPAFGSEVVQRISTSVPSSTGSQMR